MRTRQGSQPVPRQIEDMPERWANRCLPLLIANESGWILRNPVAFSARWTGRADSDAITIDHADALETGGAKAIVGVARRFTAEAAARRI